MQVVAEVPSFARQADSLFTRVERAELINYLAANPLRGDEIPGTGGVRKLRFPAQGKGKQKGARVIYLWFSLAAPIYALAVYTKGTKIDLTPAERRAVAAFAADIKVQWRRNTHA